MSEDDQITVRLTLRQWRIVTALVEGGVYRDVQPILEATYAQVNAMVAASNEQTLKAFAAQAEQAFAQTPEPSRHIQDSTDELPAAQGQEPKPAVH